jgi:hypothetical protein
MALTLAFTGMDSATEAALTAAFQQANARCGNAWRLLSEVDADHVVVDMDSMYGPMSWLRLHAAGKQVIGLTTAARTQTDFRLPRPFDVDAAGDRWRGWGSRAGSYRLFVHTNRGRRAHPVRHVALSGSAGPVARRASRAGR